MPSYEKRIEIILSKVAPEDLAINRCWENLKNILPSTINEFIEHFDKPHIVQRKIDLERIKKAVGYTNSPSRLGLVFADEKQQQDFADDFRNRMINGNYSDSGFTLVATGSAFSVFSTNPVSYQEHGYMRFWGDNGVTDLDLQLYCSGMRDQALKDEMPLFPNHFRVEGDHAQLTTFDNLLSEKVAPYAYEPWIIDFQQEWTERLSANFHGTGIIFDGIHIALMTDDRLQSKGLGSPYRLCGVP